MPPVAEFGVNLSAGAADLTVTTATAALADQAGLDLVGIPDHPYQADGLDTWTLLTHLAARTRTVRLFPNVACLPLRPPAVLARAAMTLDVLSGGRAELGMGTGWQWDGIAALGGPRLRPGEALRALADAIAVVRAQFAGATGDAGPGPAPVHPIRIWVGAVGPRMIELTGGLADGWSASVFRTPKSAFPEIHDRLDAAAVGAGRDPADVTRILNIRGSIDDGDPPARWIERLGLLTTKGRFDTVIFWPAADPAVQVERFATAVVPTLRRPPTPVP
jgi:alkanesulfonate monooxygenase SsuD/methylene tetrahydromethanopterin reductase-like flavin-dependent oxidoreductase (luciferase family)